ncbi:Aerotolerance protein BatD [hydrothermal vent metagenome]|uniref:Aerotolerance protein BatD n=1 Tax=hydrothermal vent metagenome TaxID=652676 RepID=A0A3B0ZQH8_9ZZZZ
MVKDQSSIVRWWLCGVMMMLALPALAATITAKSDRNPVAMNESFRLVFEADGRVDDDPDFKALEQSFDIKSQSQGTTMQIVNGSVSQTRQWTLVLMPKSSGRLVVPSIPFGDDKSQSLVIGVTEQAAPTSAANHSVLFIEVSAETATESGDAYVQSQVIYKARLFRAVNVANASLSEPAISDADAVIEKLGDDREFETTRDGRRYVVLERSYAIFPQQSGKLTISPLTFEGQVVNRSRGMFDVFEPGGKIRRVQSDSVVLNVQAMPAAQESQQWLPAREVQLIETWPEEIDLSKMLTAGEPLTWTLTLIADGLTAAQLPAITPVMPDGLKAYPDQARLMNDKKQDTLIGVRQEKIALIPIRAGEYQLPAVEVVWWNSLSGQREVASLPARTLRVSAAPVSNVASVAPPAMAEMTARGDVSPPVAPQQDSDWQIVSALLGFGWLLTASAWWMARRKVKQNSQDENGAVVADVRAVKKAMQRACHDHDAPAAKEALLAWANICWLDDSPKSLAEIAARVDEPFSLEIIHLNSQLYSRLGSADTDGWKGAKLWQQFERALSQHKRSPLVAEPILAPMYP